MSDEGLNEEESSPKLLERIEIQVVREGEPVVVLSTEIEVCSNKNNEKNLAEAAGGSLGGETESRVTVGREIVQRCTINTPREPKGEGSEWRRNVAKEESGLRSSSSPLPPQTSSCSLLHESAGITAGINGTMDSAFPNFEYTLTETGGPWTCKTCTYYNFSNVPSCFQCSGPRSGVVGSVSLRGDEEINSALKPLKISDCGDEGENCSEGGISITPSSAFCGGHLYNSKSKGGSTTNAGSKECQVSSYGDYWNDPPAESDEKWACPLCTFENWPASSKCSMCYTVREILSNSRSRDSNIREDTSNNNMDKNIENNRVLSESIANSSYAQRLRNRKIEAETRWLEACRGVVVGNIAPVEEYLSRGGDPARQLTSSEVALLNRPSAFDVGYTLVHLALRFQHQETLAMLLSHLDCSNTASVVKRVPSYVAPDLDQDIRNHVMGTIRYGKGSFRCNFSSEIATFTLPSGIQELSSDTRETLYDEILDHDVQKELESGQFINWSSELTVQLNSRLYALWNRSAGDCLLDSVLQATWGIFDKDNRLRQSLANSLRESASLFYQRWRENEIILSHMLDFSLDETQCAADWDNLLSVAGQPGSSLEQLHIFALAHIFRRPIIVYSVKFVKSYLGETLGYARYEGVYLPFLWDSSLCWKWPIALGYTRGHFSALVPQEPHSDPLMRASAAQLDGDGMNNRCTYLPLNTVDGNLLPIHFLSQAEVGNEEMILSQWLDLCYTNSGILVARQRIQKRPLLVAQLVEEWLNHYRTLGQMASTPYMRQSATTCYSSDGDSDND